MCDKFFESVGVSEDMLFAGGGCVHLIHQVGEKVEGGFIAHIMLSRFFAQYSKDEDSAKALVILNHHSKAHWISIGSKLGVNLSSLEEKGALTMVDLMKESYLSLKESPKARNNPLCLRSLYSRCDAAIQNYKKSNCRRVLIIVENLTNFLDSDCNNFLNSERDLVQFFAKLRALSVTDSSTCSITLASLIQSPEMPSDSFELTRFAKTVTNALSTVTFEVSPLATGFSAQVTGFLKVICNPRKTDKDKKLESAFIKTFHFKLDSNCARATAL